MATAATATTKGRPAKKVVKKNIYTGIVHIQSTFNNTIVTITDVNGAVISWASAGSRGFKGSRKSTGSARLRCSSKVRVLVVRALCALFSKQASRSRSFAT